MQPKSNEGRLAKRIAIIGTNGTGKTTFLRQILEVLARSGEKILIITPDPTEWRDVPENLLSCSADYVFTGIQKHVYEKETLDKIGSYTRGYLVFDDSRCYLRANTDERISTLLIRNRQRMLDVIFVAHGFTEVPPKFYTFMTELILFRTRDNIDRRKQYFTDTDLFEKVKSVRELVNKRAEKQPHYKQIIKY